MKFTGDLFKKRKEKMKRKEREEGRREGRKEGMKSVCHRVSGTLRGFYFTSKIS